MDKLVNESQWLEYVETPCRTQAPVKLEHILAERIQAFLRAKKAKSMNSAEINQL